jgi:hypothetical protein
MNKHQQTCFLCFNILTAFLIGSCEKQGRYDLFPLKTGNEFYYNYYKYRFTGISSYNTGMETWKIISDVKSGSSITYTIEERLNATLKVAGQTIVISDSVRFFEINEDTKTSLLSSFSMLLYKEISFKRYQDASEFEIKHEGHTSEESWSYLFKADSGLTKFTYNHPPNQISSKTLTLDSLSVFH